MISGEDFMKQCRVLIAALLSTFLIHCASPLSMQRPGHLNSSDRTQIEIALRAVDNKYRTLAAKNFTSYIRRFIGTPYEFGGISTSGMDCSGYMMVLYEEAFSITLPRSAEQMYGTLEPVSPFELQLGDLVFFQTTPGVGANHVGAYLIDSYFTHASTTEGVTISKLSDSYYKTRYLGARRVANITFE
jgi:cell wall-associated NlpC family hydrolase